MQIDCNECVYNCRINSGKNENSKHWRYPRKSSEDTVARIINEHDRFIFMGDYVDSPDIDNLSMKKNLMDIIGLKKKYPDKVVLLWGNHDIHYLLGKSSFARASDRQWNRNFMKYYIQMPICSTWPFRQATISGLMPGSIRGGMNSDFYLLQKKQKNMPPLQSF